MIKGAKGRANCQVQKVGIVGGVVVGLVRRRRKEGLGGGTNGSGPSTESEHCCDGFGCEGLVGLV